MKTQILLISAGVLIALGIVGYLHSIDTNLKTVVSIFDDLQENGLKVEVNQ